MTNPITPYPLDPTGLNPLNQVTNEQHMLPVRSGPFHLIAPLNGPFYNSADTLKLYKDGVLLQPEIHYGCINMIQDASALFNGEVCELLVLKGMNTGDLITLNYQNLGGLYQKHAQGLVNLYNETLVDERPVEWENVVNKPSGFQPAYHLHMMNDVIGWGAMITAIERLINALSLRGTPMFEALTDYVHTRLNQLNGGIPRATSDQVNDMLNLSPGAPETSLPELPVLKLGNLLQFKNWLLGLLNDKANINSPSLTGTPEVPTPLIGTNNNQIANTAFVTTLVSDGMLAHLQNVHQPVYGLVPNFAMLNEGETGSLTVLTTNVPDGTVLHWVSSGTNVTANDFGDNSLSGTVTINGGVGTILRTLKADVFTEGVENVTVYLRAEAGTATPILSQCQFSIQDTSLTAAVVFTITPSSIAVIEGNEITFNITTTNIPNGTVIYWTNLTTNMIAADFTDAKASGSILINDNQASLTRPLSPDMSINSGAVQFAVQLRTNSISGPIVTTSATITVSQFIPVPTYILSAAAAAQNEGVAVVHTVTTTDVPNGTNLYWTTSGTGITANDFTDNTLSGSITIINNSATITRMAKNDIATEGNEIYKLTIRTGSIAGPEVASSQNQLVVDTSTSTGGTFPVYGTKISEACMGVDLMGYYADGTGGTYAGMITVNSPSCGYLPGNATYAIQVAKSSLVLGESSTVTVTTTNVPNGTGLTWRVAAGTATVPGDFLDSITANNIEIQNNTATFTIGRSATGYYEYLRTFVLKLTPVGSSLLLAQSNVVNLPAASETTLQTYTITPSNGHLDPGENTRMTVTTTNVPNNTIRHWRIMSGSSSYEENFLNSIVEGDFAVNNNTATFLITRSDVDITGGNKIFQVQITTSASLSNVLATSTVITLNSNADQPRYISVIPSVTSAIEGQSITWDITTANIVNGSVYYWKITGGATAADFTQGISSGTVTVNNNLASVTLTMAIDNVLENSDTMYFVISENADYSNATGLFQGYQPSMITFADIPVLTGNWEIYDTANSDIDGSILRVASNRQVTGTYSQAVAIFEGQTYPWRSNGYGQYEWFHEGVWKPISTSHGVEMISGSIIGTVAANNVMSATWTNSKYSKTGSILTSGAAWGDYRGTFVDFFGATRNHSSWRSIN